MSKFDMHVTSVPDHHARLVVARLLLASNSSLTMQTAMEEAGKPPVLLFSGIPRKEAEQHASQFKNLGIQFVLSEISDGSIEIDNINVRGDSPDAAFDDFAGIKEHNAENAATPQPDTPKPHPMPMAGLGGNKVAPAASTHHSKTGAPQRAGIRIGSLDGSKIEAAEKSAARRSLMITIVLMTIVIIIMAIVYLIPKGDKSSKQNSSRIVEMGKRAAQKQTDRRAGGSSERQTQSAQNQSESQDSPRASVSDNSKRQANSYVDSARTNKSDTDKRIAFYKMAISFNKYNHAAWHGLLQAYTDLQMHKEARETEDKMMEIFGSEIMSVSNIVNKTYGELTDTHNDGGIYNVEYKSRKQDRDAILRDIFTMTRTVRSVCGCQDITIRAVTSSGKSMTVSTTRDVSVHSFTEFSKRANIVWSE